MPTTTSSKKTTSKKVAKKTTKKTTTKKAATKKSTQKTTTKKAPVKRSKRAGEKVLVCAPDKQCFWTTDGQVLKDLQELSAALDGMAEAVFAHHVGKERNDFADWVERVLDDAACATALRKSKKPTSAHKVVVKHLAVYKL